MDKLIGFLLGQIKCTVLWRFLRPSYQSLSKLKRNFCIVIKRKFQVFRLVLDGVYFTFFVRTYKIDGLEFYIPFELTDFIFRSRFVNNSYECLERKYIKDFLSTNAKVLELGACLGVISCFVNKQLNDNTKHVVLEANPILIDYVKKNKAHNNCGFEIENLIISKNLQNEFHVHNLIVGGSTKRKTERIINVAGCQIRDLEKKYNLVFDTLIIDIEGGELDLLKCHFLELSKINLIFMEVHPFAEILTKDQALECEDILSSINFRMIKRDGNFQIWERS